MKTQWPQIESLLDEMWSNSDPVEARIMELTAGGISEGGLLNYMRSKASPDDRKVKVKIQSLCASGALRRYERTHPRNGSTIVSYENLFHRGRAMQRRKVLGLMCMPVGAKVEFDVSQRCEDLLADIEEAARNIEWHMPGKEMSAWLSHDKKKLFVERIK